MLSAAAAAGAAGTEEEEKDQMLSRSLIARASTVDAPTIEAVNLQVRTAMSVPFAAHMLDNGEGSTAKAGEAQAHATVRVPFASYIVGEKAKS